MSRLVGKLANICADLPSEHLAGTSTFKALTGGDTLSQLSRELLQLEREFGLTPAARTRLVVDLPEPADDDKAKFFGKRYGVLADCRAEFSAAADA